MNNNNLTPYSFFDKSPSHERPQAVSYVAWLKKELLAAREKIVELELQVPYPSLDDGEALGKRRDSIIGAILQCAAILQYVEVDDDCR